MRLARSTAALAVSALVGAGVVTAAPAADAAPVFTDANTHLAPFSGAGSNATCTTTPTASTNTDVPVLENGATASVVSSGSGTTTNGATDNVTTTATATTTGSVKSAGGRVTSIDLATTGSYSVTSALPTSTCAAFAYAGADLDFRFVTTQPLVMHVVMAGTVGSSGEVYVNEDGTNPDNPFFDHYGRGLRVNEESSVLLPPGTWNGYFEGEVQRASNVTTSGTATLTASVDFTVPGSQTAPVTGKAKKYTTLPATRSCATHTLTPSVTAKKKRVAQIKKISYFVDDAKVASLKGKKIKKGAVVTIPVADTKAVGLSAEVTTKPTKPGRPSKTYTVTASYEACS